VYALPVSDPVAGELDGLGACAFGWAVLCGSPDVGEAGPVRQLAVCRHCLFPLIAMTWQYNEQGYDLWEWGHVASWSPWCPVTALLAEPVR
jgi:hypothetical protein